jgi:hypothetical protein
MALKMTQLLTEMSKVKAFRSRTKFLATPACLLLGCSGRKVVGEHVVAKGPEFTSPEQVMQWKQTQREVHEGNNILLKRNGRLPLCPLLLRTVR